MTCVALAVTSYPILSATNNTVRAYISPDANVSVLSLMPTFCKKQNLDVIVMQRPLPPAVGVMANTISLDRGDFDISTLGASMLVSVAAGADMHVVSNIAVGGYNLVARTGITWDNIKGKTFGVQSNTQVEGLFLMELERRGLTYSGTNPDVTIVRTTVSTFLPPMFDGNNIHGFTGANPYTSDVVDSGSGVLIENFEDAYRAVYALSSFSVEKEQRVRACIKDIVSAVNTPSRAAEVTAATVIAKSAGYFVELPQGKSTSYRLDTYLKPESLAKTLTWFKKSGKIPATYELPANFNRSK
jgi:ABC-type nitrate/sulfonate/bicarbonate transport system substrate-binding protein